MPDRIIKESIKRSRTLDELTPFEENCFYRLLVSADDYGRFYRDPQILKSELYPRKSDMTVKSIDDAFVSIERVSLIKSYCVEGERYLQILTWEKHQRTRAKKSRYPDENGNYTVVERRKKDTDNTKQTADSHLTTFDVKCQQVADIGQQMCPNSNSNSNNKDDGDGGAEDNVRVREEKPLIDFAEARKIADEHNEVYDAAERAGFKRTTAVLAELDKYFATYGREKMLYAIGQCVRYGAINFSYLEKALEGKPKKGGKAGATGTTGDHGGNQGESHTKYSELFPATRV